MPDAGPARPASASSGTPAAPVFELPIRVGASDLDERAHVNNVVYLRWVQDAAIAHWRALASAEILGAVAWVALRHEIDYLASAHLGDALVVRTWVGRADGMAFERFTEIVGADDGRARARARTLWCPIDAESGRARRVSREVRALVSTGDVER